MPDNKIQVLAELLTHTNQITVLTGAGMSTESGIPDFRSANGLWTKDMSLAEAVSIDYFLQDSPAFWRTFKSIFAIKIAGNYQPNEGHQFLAWLESIGKQVTILTQNIDGLHQRAGSSKVIELHGSLMSASCPSCRTAHGLDYINQNELPQCSVCGDVLKPNVVLYGEPVPHIEKALSCAATAGCLLVMGSSLEVSPVNYIPMISAENKVPSALINMTETRFDDLFSVCIHAKIGESTRLLRQAMT